MKTKSKRIEAFTLVEVVMSLSLMTVVTDVNANTKNISVEVDYATMQVRGSGTIDIYMNVVRAIH